MVKVLMGSSVALCLLLGGCGSEKTNDSPDVGTGGQQSTSGGGEGLGGMGAANTGSGGISAVGESIWNADSVEIEVGHFAFFEGGYRWRKSAREFTSEQAQLVEELKLVESTEGYISDSPAGDVIVTDENDSRKEYVFAYRDTFEPARVLVEYVGVAALLSTVRCISAKGYYSGQSGPPVVVPDDGCLHGIFSASAALPYALEVEAGETYQVAVENCRGREMKLTVLGADDEVIASVSEELGTCPTLSFMAPETGPTLLRVEDSTSQVGDFYFSLRSVD